MEIVTYIWNWIVQRIDSLTQNVIGSIVGSIILTLLGLIVGLFFIKRRKKGNNSDQTNQAGDNIAVKGNSSSVIHAETVVLGNQTNITGSPPPENGKTSPDTGTSDVAKSVPRVVTKTLVMSEEEYFTGRSDELAKIRSRIAAKRKTVLMSGLGGIGKTEICRKLYKECVNGKIPSVKHVGWINYDGNLRSSLSGKFVDLPYDDGNIEAYYRKVLNYLNDAGKELLLFIDNFNTTDALEINVLKSLACKIILTSREKIADLGTVEIDRLLPKICHKLYRKHSEDDVSADEFVDAIIALADRHTLAVELLAKTQLAARKNAEEFHAILKDCGFTLVDIPTQVEFYQHNDPSADINAVFIDHLAKVFDITGFETVDGGSADAELAEQLRILLLMSLMAFVPIAKDDANVWLELNENWTDFNKLINKGWLIEKKEGSEWFFLMHPIISAVVRHKKPADIEIAKVLILNVARKLRMETGEIFTEKLPFLPHALSIAEHFNKTADSAELARLFHNIAYIKDAQADYAQALEWYQKDLAISEKVLGKEHPFTATTYNNIAGVYDSQGKYNEALDWYEKALDIVEKVLGKEHPNTAVTYNNIALVYMNQDKYDEALEWYQKDLAISEKVLGKEHPDTATTYNNIAGVYDSQGKYNEALEWLQKALPIFEKVLGKEHPDTAGTYNNIALVYYIQGKHAEALEWYEKALPIFENVLGKEHPDTAATYNNIAGVYKDQGKYDKALEWYHKDLAISEKVLGKEHPDTAATYNNIAIVHGTQGDFNTALVWHGKALRVDNKVWGPGHMHFLRHRDNAEFAYARSGRAAPFEDWLAETLAGE